MPRLSITWDVYRVELSCEVLVWLHNCASDWGDEDITAFLVNACFYLDGGRQYFYLDKPPLPEPDSCKESPPQHWRSLREPPYLLTTLISSSGTGITLRRKCRPPCSVIASIVPSPEAQSELGKRGAPGRDQGGAKLRVANCSVVDNCHVHHLVTKRCYTSGGEQHRKRAEMKSPCGIGRDLNYSLTVLVSTLYYLTSYFIIG